MYEKSTPFHSRICWGVRIIPKTTTEPYSRGEMHEKQHFSSAELGPGMILQATTDPHGRSEMHEKRHHLAADFGVPSNSASYRAAREKERETEIGRGAEKES